MACKRVQVVLDKRLCDAHEKRDFDASILTLKEKVLQLVFAGVIEIQVKMFDELLQLMTEKALVVCGSVEDMVPCRVQTHQVQTGMQNTTIDGINFIIRNVLEEGKTGFTVKVKPCPDNFIVNPNNARKKVELVKLFKDLQLATQAELNPFPYTLLCNLDELDEDPLRRFYLIPKRKQPPRKRIQLLCPEQL